MAGPRFPGTSGLLIALCCLTSAIALGKVLFLLLRSADQCQGRRMLPFYYFHLKKYILILNLPLILINFFFYSNFFGTNSAIPASSCKAAAFWRTPLSGGTTDGREWQAFYHRVRSRRRTGSKVMHASISPFMSTFLFSVDFFFFLLFLLHQHKRESSAVDVRWMIIGSRPQNPLTNAIAVNPFSTSRSITVPTGHRLSPKLWDGYK